MALSTKTWDLQVDDRIVEIADRLREDVEFSRKQAPGLMDLLDDYINPNVDVDSVDWRRRMLSVFKNSVTDNAYQDLLAQHTDDEQDRIERFVAGEDPTKVCDGFVMGPSMGCREELAKLEDAHSIVHVSGHGVRVVKETKDLVPTDDDWFHATARKMAEFFGVHLEETGHIGDVLVHKNAKFQNWGLNIENVPSLTCVCKSASEIQTIVKFAKEHNMSVRCSGYRHSWSPVFGKTGEILISMLNLKTATKVPNTTSLPQHDSPPTELETIEVVPGTPKRFPGGALVRVGCATTNERLRKWCIKNNKYTLPANVIMVEITLGGSNAIISHGAGRQNRTLSDLVRKIEYVDANGMLRTVDKPEHLRAASGCFGLMGPVTHITMEFPPMTYAELAPLKMPVICAVPPPPNLDEKHIPPALLKYWTKLSPPDKKKCQNDFESRATNDYYSEWFWFPYSDYAWVNTWNDTKDSTGVEDFPDTLHIFLSFIETFAMNVMQNSKILGMLNQLTGFAEAATTLLSRTALFALSDKAVKTYLPDGLHFQRAIQNIRVRDIEVEMPLVAKKGSTNDIDYRPVQQAWWDAILLTYKHNDSCPMRMPLEMRIMGGSNVIMAPQRGNELGTCSIEVLTLHNANKIWPAFAQEVLDKWMALEDPNTGKKLRTRPHWAKEWYDLNVDGRPWFDRLKNVDYKDEIAEFLGVFKEIGDEDGWTLEDLKARFSNDYFEKMFFDQVGNASNVTNGV